VAVLVPAIEMSPEGGNSLERQEVTSFAQVASLKNPPRFRKYIVISGYCPVPELRRSFRELSCFRVRVSPSAIAGLRSVPGTSVLGAQVLGFVVRIALRTLRLTKRARLVPRKIPASKFVKSGNLPVLARSFISRVQDSCLVHVIEPRRMASFGALAQGMAWRRSDVRTVVPWNLSRGKRVLSSRGRVRRALN